MFDEITKHQMQMFEKLASRLQLRSEVKKLNEEIETFKVKGEIEGIDYAKEIKLLKTRLDTLKGELEEEGLISDPEIIKIKLEIDQLEQRLRTLEKKKSNISETVFKRLNDEYREHLSTAQERFTQEEKKIREFYYKSKDFLEKNEELIEELKIRKELGDISQKMLESKLDDLEDNERKAKIILSATKILIDGNNS